MSFSLLAAAREEPGREALIVDGRTLRFGELAPPVRQAMAWLGRHLGGAPRVALVARAELDAVVMLYALVETGVPVLLVHPRSTPAERARLLDEAAPIVLVPERWSEEAGAAPAVDPAPLPDDERPLAVLHTSGSAGRSRGVVLSRAAFAAAADASAEVLGWRVDDRWILSLPFAHVGGLSVLLRCLRARRAVVLAPPQLSTEATLATLARDRVTLASFVPTQLARLAGAPPPPSLRVALVGGAAASPELLARALARGWAVRATYGLTEACSQVATWREGDGPTDGCGPPLPGCEARISDAGEIQLRGPSLLSGFFPPGDRAPRLPDGWLATGDLGRLDERGRLHVLGRRDDLIISGGENVFPLEVEQALEGCAGVAAACVFAIPDEEWGQRICAALVASGAPPEDAALAAELREALAGYKRPRAIAWLDALPALPGGKIDRAATVAAARARLRSFG